MAEKETEVKTENALVSWENAEFGTIRSKTIDGEPYFVAKDVAMILGYKKTNDMTKRLDEDEKGATICRTPGGKQKLAVISESGLYHAIFLSRLDAAKEFRRWVTSEVLPAIRKSGNYTASPVVNVRDMAVTLQKLTERVSALEQAAVRESAALALPDMTDTREKVVDIVRRAAKDGKTSEQETWCELYKDYSKMTGIPVMQCAKALNISTISFIDLVGRMESLKRFAEQLFWFV